jgi:hypothetical protein
MVMLYESGKMDILYSKNFFEAMNPEKLVSRRLMDNGLTLELWDRSRPVAGDRWYVALEVRIAVPITKANLPPELTDQAGEVAGILGPNLIFSHLDERNFIAEGEVKDIINEMAERARELTPRYFGHPEFAPRIIRRKYAEYREKSLRHRS